MYLKYISSKKLQTREEKYVYLDSFYETGSPYGHCFISELINLSSNSLLIACKSSGEWTKFLGWAPIQVIQRRSLISGFRFVQLQILWLFEEQIGRWKITLKIPSFLNHVIYLFFCYYFLHIVIVIIIL